MTSPPLPHSARPAALEVAHLSVSFGRHRVITDLSFTVPAGHSLAIIGPNGSGKTVLFKALIGAVRAKGTILWAPGTAIGYVPQKLDIERDLPLAGLDLLNAMADVTAVSREAVPGTLTLVDLPEAIARQPIGTLSGGQFQHCSSPSRRWGARRCSCSMSPRREWTSRARKGSTRCSAACKRRKGSPCS